MVGGERKGLVTDAKTHARIEIRKVKAVSGILPFAVPEVEPGAVAVILTDENAAAGSEVLAATEISQNLNPLGPISKFNVYDGLVGGIEITNRDNISVIVLVSKTNMSDPDLSGTSVAAICGRAGVRCYSGSGKQDGPALIHGYESGSASLPALRRVDVTGCNDAINLSGPYFSRTGDCVISVSAEIDFGGAINPQARLYNSATCSGSFTPMSQAGNIWSAPTTLPEPSKFTGQVPFTIAWKAGSGGFKCFPGGTVPARTSQTGNPAPSSTCRSRRTRTAIPLLSRTDTRSRRNRACSRLRSWSPSACAHPFANRR